MSVFKTFAILVAVMVVLVAAAPAPNPNPLPLPQGSINGPKLANRIMIELVVWGTGNTDHSEIFKIYVNPDSKWHQTAVLPCFNSTTDPTRVDSLYDCSRSSFDFAAYSPGQPECRILDGWSSLQYVLNDAQLVVGMWQFGFGVLGGFCCGGNCPYPPDIPVVVTEPPKRAFTLSNRPKPNPNGMIIN